MTALRPSGSPIRYYFQIPRFGLIHLNISLDSLIQHITQENIIQDVCWPQNGSEPHRIFFPTQPINMSRCRLTLKSLSKGLMYQSTLIFAVLQQPTSQNAQIILKSSWHLPASRYHTILLIYHVSYSKRIFGMKGVLF